jgi:hypothetical protein
LSKNKLNVCVCAVYELSVAAGAIARVITLSATGVASTKRELVNPARKRFTMRATMRSGFSNARRMAVSRSASVPRARMRA